MTTSHEQVAAEALVARIEELLPKVTAGPWVHDNNEGYGSDNIWSRCSPSGNAIAGRLVATAIGDDPDAEENASWIALFNPENVKVLLSALRRQSPAGHANAVKALEWQEPTRATNGCWTAESIFGTFSVAFDDGWHAELDDGLRWEWEPEADPRSYEGPSAAQRACQEFHDRRILSALTASPSPAGAVAPAAGVEALAKTMARDTGRSWTGLTPVGTEVIPNAATNGPGTQAFWLACARSALAALQPAAQEAPGGLTDAGLAAARAELMRADPETGGLISPALLRRVCTAALSGSEAERWRPSPGAQDVLAERRRQIEAEDFDASYDDMATTGQLAGAAACYALTGIAHWAKDQAIKAFWPWDAKWWKPSDPRRDLVKAGALIIAEIDRLDRRAPTNTAIATGGNADG